MSCSRCGKCCGYILDGENRICKYIRINDDNTTFCPIYANRIGTIIDSKIIIKDYRNMKGKNLVKKIICGYRKDDPRIIEGCTEKGLN